MNTCVCKCVHNIGIVNSFLFFYRVIIRSLGPIELSDFCLSFLFRVDDDVTIEKLRESD